MASLVSRVVFLTLLVFKTTSISTDPPASDGKQFEYNFGRQTSVSTAKNESHQSDELQKRNLTEECTNRSCIGRVEKIYPTTDSPFACYCDELCQAMKDCCYDYVPFNRSSELSLSEFNSTWKCLKFGTVEVWMIVNCTESWTDAEILSKCIKVPRTLNSSTYAEFIPVVGADNLTYRNQYCAICNYQNNFDHWSLKIDVYPAGVSDFSGLMDFLVNYYGTKMNNLPVPKERLHPRRYCLKSASTCGAGHNDTVVKNCLYDKVGIVYKGIVPYKNKDCAICNDITLDKISCGPRISPNRSREGPPVLANYDFFVNIDFRNSQKTRFVFSENCADIFDSHLKKCVTHKELVSLEKSPLDKYRIALWVKSAKDLPQRNRTAVIAQFLNDVSESNIQNPRREFLSSEGGYTYILIFDVELTFVQSGESSRNDTSDADVASGTYSIRKFIQTFSKPFSVLFGTQYITVFKSTYRRLACFGLKTYNVSEYVKMRDQIFVNSTGKYYSSDEYFESGGKNGSIQICEQQLPGECDGRYIKYNRSEFKVAQDSLSLSHKETNELYRFNEYTVQGDTVFICHEVSSLITGDNIRGLITIISCTLSVVGLVCVLITYSLFSLLRTPPGKNIINLALALLIFNVLWLIRGWTANPRLLCIVMTFLRPYFILVSLTSMGKIAHDTMGMFTDPIRHQRRNTSRPIIFLLVWFIPVLHVTTCLTLWYYGILTVSHQECLITGAYNYIVIFVPACISMFYNIICLARSISAMRKLEQNGKMLRAQKQEKGSLFVYIKLSTLLGLGWTSSFIAVIFPEFSYVFIFLTLSQGLYIFLAFVCNKNVLVLYQKLLKGQSSSRQTIRMRSTMRESAINGSFKME